MHASKIAKITGLVVALVFRAKLVLDSLGEPLKICHAPIIAEPASATAKFSNCTENTQCFLVNGSSSKLCRPCNTTVSEVVQTMECVYQAVQMANMTNVVVQISIFSAVSIVAATSSGIVTRLVCIFSFWISANGSLLTNVYLAGVYTILVVFGTFVFRFGRDLLDDDETEERYARVGHFQGQVRNRDIQGRFLKP